MIDFFFRTITIDKIADMYLLYENSCVLYDGNYDNPIYAFLKYTKFCFFNHLVRSR